MLHVQTLEDLRPLMKVGIPGLGLAGVFFYIEILEKWNFKDKNGIWTLKIIRNFKSQNLENLSG